MMMGLCSLLRLLQVLLELAGAPELASGGASWAVNERQAEALVRAHEALMRVRSRCAAVPCFLCTV